MKQRLFIFFQYVLPHHVLSRLAGCVAECRVRWFKNAFTQWFVRRYQVDMSQALVEDITGYEHFNAFFTRALKPGARPLDETPGAILCPADGAVSQLGAIEHGRIFQAKGHSFSTLELLGGDARLSAPFMGGEFATIYLSPKDYHRVHMPLAGTLREMVYVPGRIFSVNQTTAENVPELFARNERVVCLFDTERGPMAVVLVGAMIVASIETVWARTQDHPLRRSRPGASAPGKRRGAGSLQTGLYRHRFVWAGPGEMGRTVGRRIPDADGPGTGTTHSGLILA
jgi:phosphatidylserine decarboxylase